MEWIQKHFLLFYKEQSFAWLLACIPPVGLCWIFSSDHVGLFVISAWFVYFCGRLISHIIGLWAWVSCTEVMTSHDFTSIENPPLNHSCSCWTEYHRCCLISSILHNLCHVDITVNAAAAAMADKYQCCLQDPAYTCSLRMVVWPSAACAALMDVLCCLLGR